MTKTEVRFAAIEVLRKEKASISAQLKALEVAIKKDKQATREKEHHARMEAEIRRCGGRAVFIRRYGTGEQVENYPLQDGACSNTYTVALHEDVCRYLGVEPTRFVVHCDLAKNARYSHAGKLYCAKHLLCVLGIRGPSRSGSKHTTLERRAIIAKYRVQV